MSENTQPDLQWGPLEQKPRGRGRVWLIVGLVVAALVIVGVLLFFLLPRGESPAPDATATASPSERPPSGSPTPGPPSDEPTAPPVTSAPEPVDPTLDAFRAQVEVWLEDGVRGLDIVAATSGEDAASAVTILQEDAQRLNGVLAPSAIATEWSSAVLSYADSLVDLRQGLASESDKAAELERASSALQELRRLVGL